MMRFRLFSIVNRGIGWNIIFCVSLLIFIVFFWYGFFIVG